MLGGIRGNGSYFDDRRGACASQRFCQGNGAMFVVLEGCGRCEIKRGDRGGNNDGGNSTRVS